MANIPAVKSATAAAYITTDNTPSGALRRGSDYYRLYQTLLQTDATDPGYFTIDTTCSALVVGPQSDIEAFAVFYTDPGLPSTSKGGISRQFLVTPSCPFVGALPVGTFFQPYANYNSSQGLIMDLLIYFEPPAFFPLKRADFEFATSSPNAGSSAETFVQAWVGFQLTGQTSELIWPALGRKRIHIMGMYSVLSVTPTCTIKIYGYKMSGTKIMRSLIHQQNITGSAGAEVDGFEYSTPYPNAFDFIAISHTCATAGTLYANVRMQDD